jgi:hypothetical protein
MDNVQLSIVASGSVRKKDVATVLKAARSFDMYGGVQCDVREPDKKGLRGVRYPSFVRDVLSRPDMHATNDLKDRWLGILRESILPRDNIGVGFTTERLFARERSIMGVEVIGAGTFASCGFLSTAVIDRDSETSGVSREDLLEAAARYEISLILRAQGGHCKNDNCIARATETLERLIDTVEKKLGFCSPCQRGISQGVRMIQEGVTGRPNDLFDNV